MKRLLGFLLTASLMALGHGAVPERPESYRAEAHSVLDNRPEHSRLVALDLPQRKAVAELFLPPRGMSLVATPSAGTSWFPRGRDTDRQWLTVVWTGRRRGAGAVPWWPRAS
ncbi:MAG: hypothetical protein ABDH20_12855, partial [Thermus sp.]